MAPSSYVATVPACALQARHYFIRVALECTPATGCAGGADRRALATPFRLTAAMLPTVLPIDASARQCAA